MAEPDKKDDQILIKEAQDGSATVEVSDDMLNFEEETNPVISTHQNSDENKTIDEDADHPDDDDDLRSAKRNRRRAKKDLIRKTNQEKDVRLQQLQRENEQFKQRLNQLERNTKAEHITRLDKGIEDAQVRLEYAKMKLSEATQNNDGQAMVEAQELWQTANEEARRLNSMKAQANRELNRPPSPQIDPEVQRQAAQWMSRNKWYNPAATDADSRR
jgi:hypothetical protein